GNILPPAEPEEKSVIPPPADWGPKSIAATGGLVAGALVLVAVLVGQVGNLSYGRPSLRQRVADDLLVVPGEHALVRERRMGPDDLPPERLVSRLEELRPVDLLVPLGRQLRDHQVAGLAEDEVAVPVLNQERRRGVVGPPVLGVLVLPDDREHG